MPVIREKAPLVLWNGSTHAVAERHGTRDRQRRALLVPELEAASSGARWAPRGPDRRSGGSSRGGVWEAVGLHDVQEAARPMGLCKTAPSTQCFQSRTTSEIFSARDIIQVWMSLQAGTRLAQIRDSLRANAGLRGKSIQKPSSVTQ